MGVTVSVDGEVIAGQEEVKKRWGEHFKGLLSMLDDREMDIYMKQGIESWCLGN